MSAKLMTETMPKALAPDETEADVYTRSRLERDRQAATARFMRDRDVAELQAMMTRLDAEESQAKERGSGEVTPPAGTPLPGELIGALGRHRAKGITRHRGGRCRPHRSGGTRPRNTPERRT